MKMQVRRLERGAATEVVAAHHYLGTMPNVSSRSWGVYDGDDLMSVCILSTPGNSSGVARQFGLDHLKGNMELSRLVCVPEAPRNMATHTIALLCRLWGAEGLDWVFSYADTGQNHHGGIYQGVNAIYLGLTRTHAGFLVDGVPVHPRTLARMYGTIAEAKLPSNVVRVPHMMTAKHLYVMATGNRTSKRQVNIALEGKTRPYPRPSDPHR